jgi:hypothetical protein
MLRSPIHRIVAFAVVGIVAWPPLVARVDSEIAVPASRAHLTADGPPPGCTERVYERLFFGLSMAGGSVSEGDWRRFLATVVTPRFPNGLTVFHGRGQWRAVGEFGVTVEPSRVVEVAHDDTVEVNQRLAEVIALYKQRHRQRSVMRTRSRVEVCW